MSAPLLVSANGGIPLYMQVRELLVAKINAGDWLPGDYIPSELSLSRELGVSQGTVRKAVTELVEFNVLKRKQGKGTYILNHDSERALFHFFHVVDKKGHRAIPDSTVLRCSTQPARAVEALKLQLKDKAAVIRIERIRHLSGKPTMTETITLPANLFKSWDTSAENKLPNRLYERYENQFGITIHSAEEQLRAVPATKREAKLLEVSPGTPLLEIERLALTLNRTPVELRISRCITKKHHYENTIF